MKNQFQMSMILTCQVKRCTQTDALNLQPTVEWIYFLSMNGYAVELSPHLD